MNDIFESVNQAKFDFLGPTIFTVILLIGIGVGFLNGYKTAALFLILNVVSLAVAIVILNFSKEIAESIVPTNLKIKGVRVRDMLNDGLPETIRKNPGIKIGGDFVKENKGFQGVYDIVASNLLLIVYVGLNIFIFMPIYFFFRKRLKETMFINKRMGKSNIKYRLGGAVFGFFVSIPVALIVGSLFAAFGNVDNSFTSFISSVTKFVFLGKVKDIPNSINQLANLIDNTSITK